MNKKFSFKALAVVIAAVLSFVPTFAYALADGTYTCTITTHYAHPQTGVIEDAGGESSKKMGQSMTEGAVDKVGLFEQTNNGSYVTLRFLLMDAVSDVSFFIDGNAVSHEVTQENTSPSGNVVADLRLKVPSDSSIIKCKMYVEPMDRYVVFFITMSDFKQGQGDFKATGAQSTSASQNSSNAQSDALTKIEALKNLDSSQRDLFVASVKNAKSDDEIKDALKKAEEADAKAAEENQLGEAKSEAFKKIDEMNLSPEKAKELKQKIKDAKSVAEVENVLKSQSSSPVLPIIGVVAVVVIVVLVVVKKKKDTSSEDKPNKEQQ